MRLALRGPAVQHYRHAAEAPKPASQPSINHPRLRFGKHGAARAFIHSGRNAAGTPRQKNTSRPGRFAGTSPGRNGCRADRCRSVAGAGKLPGCGALWPLTMPDPSLLLERQYRAGRRPPAYVPVSPGALPDEPARQFAGCRSTDNTRTRRPRRRPHLAGPRPGRRRPGGRPDADRNRARADDRFARGPAARSRRGAHPGDRGT